MEEAGTERGEVCDVAQMLDEDDAPARSEAAARFGKPRGARGVRAEFVNREDAEDGVEPGIGGGPRGVWSACDAVRRWKEAACAADGRFAENRGHAGLVARHCLRGNRGGSGQPRKVVIIAPRDGAAS